MSGLQRAGKDFDNSIAAAIHEITDDEVRANSRRGSGNTITPAADVLVRTPKVDSELELKRFSRPRPDKADTVSEASAYIDTETFAELLLCQNKYTHSYLGVKFTNCQLWIGRVPYLHDIDKTIEYVAEFVVPDAFAPKVTSSGNLRLTKPSLDDWPSSSGGKSDAAVVCEELGIGYDE